MTERGGTLSFCEGATSFNVQLWGRQMIGSANRRSNGEGLPHLWRGRLVYASTNDRSVAEGNEVVIEGDGNGEW